LCERFALRCERVLYLEVAVHRYSYGGIAASDLA
jgi:hypothetical protein